MVFQSVLSHVLNKYLGEFVENLDEKQLNVGIWGGDVELKDLVIKPSALDELDVPVQCIYGKLGKLVLKIPWKSLYTSRTVITVEDIYILVHPNQQVKYDAEKDAKSQLDSKLKTIQRIEEKKKAQEDKLLGKGPEKQGWTIEFAEKLVTTIIKNLQLNIKHIHIRYEDKVTNPKAPFSMGITLDELSVESTNANWEKILTDEIVKIYKILNLGNLGVYWNCNTSIYADLPVPEMLKKLQTSIATIKSNPEDSHYVLGPIQASVRLKMNPKPELDDTPYSSPKFVANLQMEKLFLGLNKCQYLDIIALVDSMSRMARGLPYRKFRPNLNTYKGHYREWWQFAMQSVLEEEVRRVRKNWDWNHILAYRNMCREYKELCLIKGKSKTKPEDEQKIMEYEKALDITNLIIIREQVRLEIRRLSQTSQTGWFGWMWGGNKNNGNNDKDKIMNKINEEMTPAEKQQLYAAIDYQENEGPVNYPEDYVDISTTFLLKSFVCELSDVDKTLKSISVLKCSLDSVRCKFESRPALQGITVLLKVGDLVGRGFVDEDYEPYLISSDSKQKTLVEILFELNPSDGHCDQRLHVNVQPVKIVYDAVTVNRLVDVFTVPPDSNMESIQDAATNTMTDFKEMSSLGLQYTLTKQPILDVDIDCQAPYLILPYAGKYTGSENVLVVDLGNLRIYSVGKRSSIISIKQQHEEGKTNEEIFKYMQEHSYDRFRLELANLQVITAQSDEDWKASLLDHRATNMHLLHPVTLAISYSKCLISDDPRLPQNHVLGEIPSINIVVSDARLILALSIVTSIEFPGGGDDLPELKPLTKTASSLAILSRPERLIPVAPDLDIMGKAEHKEVSERVQFTLLTGTFLMPELSVRINTQNAVSDTPRELAAFKVEYLKCDLKQLTYSTKVTVNLKGVGLHVERFGAKVNLIETPQMGDDPENSMLFRVSYLQVDPKCPEIHSHYQSCESSLQVIFSVLRVVLHKEGILELMKFGTDIQSQIAMSSRDKLQTRRIASATLKRTASTASHLSLGSRIGEAFPKKRGKKQVTVETIKFKLMATLGEVSVKLCTDMKEISKCSIKSLKTSILVKNTYTQINATLVDLSVLDLNRQSVHKQILSRIEGEALTAQVVINNIDDDDYDSEIPNIAVIVRLGQFRIIYMNWFVSNMLNFMNQFQAAQTAIMEASQAAAAVAKENMKEAYEKAQKVALDIKLQAPLILIPIDSKSYDLLSLDMGVLTLKNHFFTLDIKNENGIPVTVDDLSIALDDLKVSRAVVDQEYKIIEERIMLQPTTINLTVKRNLSTSWYTSIPDIEVSGKIPSIHIVISNVDYQGVLHILNGNLAEGVVETVLAEDSKEASSTPPEPRFEILTLNPDMDKAEVAKDIWLSSAKDKPHISLKLTFFMDTFMITMFYKQGANLKTDFGHDNVHQFAKFSLEGLSVKGRILTDGSIVTSVLLLRCILDDTRPDRQDKLNRLIDRSTEKVATSYVDNEALVPTSAAKSMIDVTFQQKGNDTFLDVRIFSFTIVISMDYLMQLADFFTVPPQETVAHFVKVSESAGSTKVSKQHKPPPETKKPAAGNMTLNLKVEKPDILLVEHMEHVDAKAIALTGEILVKFRQSGKHQVVNGVMKDLELYRCIFNPDRRPYTKAVILHPVEISLAGSTPPEKGLHLELLVTDLDISVSPTTIELLNSVLTAVSTTSSDEKTDKDEFSYGELWDPKAYNEEDYWFLNIESGGDVLDLLEPKELVVKLEELCIISVPKMTLTVEGGDANKTLPLVILETGFRGSVRNWSSLLYVEASLTMQMGYYNSKLAMWEPLIEPEVISEHKHSPWELRVEMFFNSPTEENTYSYPGTLSPSSELVETENQIDLPKPLMSIGVSSTKNLEITVTNTLLDMTDYLMKAFGAALDKEQVMETGRFEAPYKVINELGEDIILILEESSFTDIGAPLGDVNKVAVPLQLKPQYAYDAKLHLSKEFLGGSIKEAYNLKIQIQSLDSTLTLPVMKADKRYFPLNYRSTIHDSWGIISDVTVAEAITTIVLRSPVQVHNHFDVVIDVYYMTSKGNQLEFISQVKPREKLNVPLKAVYTPTTELFFGTANYSITAAPFAWKALQSNLKVTKNLHCFPKNNARENIPFIISAVGELEQVYLEQTNRHTMTSTCYNIHLRPAVTFKNSLPLTIVCCVDESPDEFTVEPGDTLQLPTVDPGTNYLVIRIPEYLEKEWSCRKEIVRDPDEFSVWTFSSYDSATQITLDLGMHVEKKTQALLLTLYCPFWMINKTGLLLGYRKSKKGEKDNSGVLNSPSSSKNSDEGVNVLYHPANFEGPILFSFNAKNFFGKKKASVRVDNGEWSNKFSIDVAGSSGTVNCKWNDQIYQVGVQNTLTYTGLTKQITFTPYYIIINEAPYPIECQEHSRPADPWVVVQPKSCEALWPKNDKEDKLIKLRVKGTTEHSAPFLFTESHTTLLKLDNKFGGVNVDIQITEGATLINVAPYEDGGAPALLINHSNYVISYWEKESVQKRLLQPSQSVLYTWENPSGPRVLVWDRGNKKEISNDLRKDIYGQFSPKDGVYIYWTSFLDGMQRILLFTEERFLAEAAQASNILEQIHQEITVAVHGIGVSLVNSVSNQEILYIGIASSGIIWESSRVQKERFKYLDKKLSDQLEASYQECLREAEVNPKHTWHVRVDSKTEVDFKNNIMHKPNQRKIRRTFLTGLWLQMKTSPSQKQIHAKINRLQIDNQLYDCIFPVVLAPVPPPKSLASETIKPFIEVSIVQLLMKNSQILQFKYFKVLVQEFHVKLDIGFVNAILDMFSEAEATPEKEKEQFLLDKKHVTQTLYQLASTQSIQQQKSFYDLLHFSPLKIHISFSLATTGNEQLNAPPFVNVLLQGLGVTLTDMNDVIFKLAFFERNYTFLTQNQLISECTTHYIGQAIKQFYVLVLGLDVLGNPYGLVLGITKGVEDLFYEPFQGAIQGPGEFVEGLAIGVKSLFGHTVGGAAGAVSKITGAMGKGIAALTFDEDYQRKRREHKNRKPTNVQEGLARGGKGVVMGFYSGVTGVFTKPVEGAKEQGVEGFFKGLGKGAMGLVTRPVSGVVDFASESLDVVRRAAEGNEDTLRLRNPRFMHPDRLVRPYNRYEAEGTKYLHNISKGKYAKTDVYVAHYHVIQGKEVLLLTDRRVAYITHSDVFGGWQIEWSYIWEEVTSPAKVGPKGVFIQTSEKKKVFGSKEFGKMVLVANPKTREEICEKIESLRTI